MFKELYVFFEKWNNKSTEHKFIILARIMSALLTVFIVLVIVIDWTDIWGMGNKVWHLRFFNHFFVDSDNKFNWIGITSVLAIISLTFTAWDSRRKFKADLISKSRIKWINEFRKIVAEYLQQVSEYWLLMAKYNKSDERGKNELFLEVNNITTRLQKSLSLIQLQFGEGKRNNEFLEYFEIFSVIVNDNRYVINKIYDGEEITKEESQTLLNIDKNCRKHIGDVVEKSRKYLKEEWEKAKKGE